VNRLREDGHAPLSGVAVEWGKIARFTTSSHNSLLRVHLHVLRLESAGVRVRLFGNRGSGSAMLRVNLAAIYANRCSK